MKLRILGNALLNNEGSVIIYRLINDSLFIGIISMFIRTILALPGLEYLLILHLHIVLVLMHFRHPYTSLRLPLTPRYLTLQHNPACYFSFLTKKLH